VVFHLRHVNRPTLTSWGAVLVLVIATVSCGTQSRADVVTMGNAFSNRMMAESLDTAFTMDSLTDFKWDRVWVFPPYTTAGYIDGRLGTRVDYAHGAGSIETDSIRCMFVFKRGDTVVAVTDIDLRSLNVFELTGTEAAPSDRFIKRMSGGGAPRVLSYPSNPVASPSR
jgi:hypothetical protein